MAAKAQRLLIIRESGIEPAIRGAETKAVLSDNSPIIIVDFPGKKSADGWTLDYNESVRRFDLCKEGKLVCSDASLQVALSGAADKNIVWE